MALWLDAGGRLKWPRSFFGFAEATLRLIPNISCLRPLVLSQQNL